MNYYPLFRARSRNNGMRCMFFTFLYQPRKVHDLWRQNKIFLTRVQQCKRRQNVLWLLLLTRVNPSTDKYLHPLLSVG